MGKRKKSMPQRADHEKRKCMTWSLYDGQNQGSLSIFSDDDPEVMKEQTKSQETASTSKASTESGSMMKNQHIQKMFDSYLETTTHTISIYKEYTKPNDWHKKIGSIKFVVADDKSLFEFSTDFFRERDEFWLYVGVEGCRSFIYTETEGADKQCKFWCIYCDVPALVLGSLEDKVFQLVLDDIDEASQTLEVTVYIRHTALVDPKFACEPIKPRKHKKAMQNVVGHFLGVTTEEYDGKYSRKHDIEDLYEVVKEFHNEEQNTNSDQASLEIQHPYLIPRLRPYQQEAVRWMIQQETNKKHADEDHHMLYSKVTFPDGSNILYNRHIGSFTLQSFPPAERLPGGILADEMGLGKTVEVLACIMLNPRPDPVDIRVSKESVNNELSPETKTDSQPLVDGDSKENCEGNLDNNDDKVVNQKCETCHIDLHVVNQKCEACGEEQDKSKRSEITNSIDNGGSHDQSCDISLSATSGTVRTCDKPTSAILTNETLDIALSIGKTECVSDKNCDQSEPDQGSCDLEDSQCDQINGAIELSHDVSCDVSTIVSDQLSTKSNESDQIEMENKSKTKKRGRKSKVVRTEEILEYKNIFEDKKMLVGPKDFFECICGMREVDALNKNFVNKTTIQCVRCSLRQHAECVNFDLTDPHRPDFICPHCLAEGVSPLTNVINEICPHCLAEGVALKSKATLIVSPSYICHQWVDEILKHIKDEKLKILVYKGVHKQGYVQPSTLAQQDIVITIYETLRKEIDYVDLPHTNSETGRKFRHPKRFMVIPSPMTAVDWWRVCLDEAQMVECTTTKTAMMALRLTTVNRWCVTGTPIQRGIEDLYGLFLFLGLDPYWVQQWFDTLLYKPLCYGVTKPVYNVVPSVLWRTAKKDVINQINLPEQTEHVHWLTFSPVEDHFYRRQYHNCVRECMKDLRKWTDNTTKLSSLDRHTVSNLLNPLLRLRQACCHPQAVRGEFTALNKSTMTMEELLESLTKKAKTECEDAHRQIVAAINGQAGLHIIKEEYIEAVEKYREVLRSAEEHKEQLRTDELQQLHALHNLQEIIELKPKGLEPTLRDGQLADQAKDIRDRYMARAESKVKHAQNQLKNNQATVTDHKNELGDGSEWWLDVIYHALERQIDDELIEHVKSDLHDNSGSLGPHMSLANMFKNTRGLELVLEQRLDALETAREKLMTSLDMLSQGLTPKMINQTVACCLRPVGEISGDCPFCETDQDFQDYESKLYSFTEQGLVVSGDQYQVGTRRQGTWADSQVERALKAIISFARHERFDHDLISQGQTHIKVFDAMKKEFKGFRSVWMSLREQVSSIDELEMATTRLRLRLPDEDEPTTAQLHILEPSAIEQQRQKLKSDLIIGQCELRKKLGQLLYLRNLAKTQNEHTDGRNPEPCPICQRELGVEWSVMHCGHCYCLDCINILMEQYSFGGRNRVIKCAICREKTYKSDVSFVSTKKTQDDEDEHSFVIKGSHSTKVQGIVREMIKIHHKDPEAKILVFSTWVEVLNVVSSALIENNVVHRMLTQGNKFERNLVSFKEDKDVTALLLPVQHGANGLNLIEATYVFLVEPILNPAQELQAVGRVHRIGQTRPTEVHRFLIRGTIEQKMYHVLKSIESKASSHDTEENSLTIGDITALLSEEQRNQDQPDYEMGPVDDMEDEEGETSF